MKITCIMPTADRRFFVPDAIAGFLAQDCTGCELIVLDNGREPIEALVPRHPRIRYVRETSLRTLGALRNRACELAHGDIIAHWDDDDWYPSDRLSRQVAALETQDADVCGSSRIYYFDRAQRRAWEYAYRDARKPWVAGPTLAYRRRYWERHRFPDVQIGEDTRFVWNNPAMRMIDLADPSLCVAAIHAGNTSRKRPAPPLWRTIDAGVIEGLLARAPRSCTSERVETPVAPAVDSVRRICIGVYVDSEPQRLDESLHFLDIHTTAAVNIVVLGDGVDEPLRHVDGSRAGLRLSCTAEPLGAAASFNRLIRDNDADVYVFLESGALVGPGWLEALCRALDADAAHGLAGPTTNMSWNAQGAFTNRRASAGNVALLAREACARYGEAWQPLQQLHCLADFCYVVKREVVDAIGAADDAYGAGPCWEMDYTLRAARAGFRAVWAQGAYVFRAPFTSRRQRDEARLFEVNKHLYQDKFCGLRLAGADTSYAEHCKGEACEHFAPREKIRITIPLRSVAIGAVTASPGVRPSAVPPAVPLVSCIMPTRDRPEWVLQSIAYFQRQDYPHRELIVVDDGAESIKSQLPCDPRILYLRIERRLSIGAKRNLACEHARGEFIAHWDDDDWYAPTRLSVQAASLLEGTVDVTAFDGTVFFDLDRWHFWICEPALFARLFVGAVHGGTLMFRRTLHGAASRYPDASLAEDAAFLNTVVARGARLRALPADGQFLYLRHGTNSWRLGPRQTFGNAGWRRIEEPISFAADRAFYLLRRKPSVGRSAA
jgi:glycosyltransferase involved in cell wall biosynthesis